MIRAHVPAGPLLEAVWVGAGHDPQMHPGQDSVDLGVLSSGLTDVLGQGQSQHPASGLVAVNVSHVSKVGQGVLGSRSCGQLQCQQLPA